MLILSVLSNPRPSRGIFSVPVPFLRLLPDPVQYSDAGMKLGRGKIVVQFMTKLGSLRVNSCVHTLCASCQMNGLAPAIVRRIFSRYPLVVFEAMQQRDQGWFFDAKMRGDFGLG